MFLSSPEYWDKCIEIDDENPLYWVHKAFNYGMWGKDDEFGECLDKAADMDPMIMYLVEDFMEKLDDE